MTETKKLTILWHSPYNKGIIAAFIMGEGTITISSQGRGWYTPRITIVNTEKEIINLASFILNKVGINYQFRYSFSPTQKGAKKIYRIDIKGIKSVLPLLLSLRSSFVGRKEHLSELVIEFCKSRLKNLKEHYSSREREIIKQIRILNPRGRNIILKEECC